MVRDTWTRVASVVAFVMAIALAGSAVAAAEQSFPLMGQDDSPKAKGTAMIQDTRLTVTANGARWAPLAAPVGCDRWRRGR